MSSPSTIPLSEAIQTLNHHLTTYNWLTSLPPAPICETRARHTPTVTHPSHTIAAMTATTEPDSESRFACEAEYADTVVDIDDDGYEPDDDSDSDSSVVGDYSSLALRYVPTPMPQRPQRSQSRLKRVKKWFGRRVRALRVLN